MHADTCSYFPIPLFQATIRDFMQPDMEWCLLAQLQCLCWHEPLQLHCTDFFSFFFPFNKNLGWCWCGQHYIWWDNSTSHSSWEGLNKIGSSSQSSRYGNRSLLESFVSQWEFKLKGCKQKRMCQWTCLRGGGSQMLKARRSEFPQKVLLWVLCV